MKTHQLADAMQTLAGILRSMPNVELESLKDTMKWPVYTGEHIKPNVAVSVGTLAALSRMDKGSWQELIDQWRLPIAVHPKDSARNTMGQVLRYLETHPHEIRRLQDRMSKVGPRTSSALTKALSILLADLDEESSERD